MKKRNLVTMIIWSGLLLTVLFGKAASSSSSMNGVMDDAAGGDGPTISVLNINNMASWVYKNGAGTTSGSPNGEQVDYPIFTGGLIYEDGMLWGVKSDEYPEAAPIRVGGSTYYHGTHAGKVIYNADGDVVGSTDPTSTHVWRVRSDYATADLSTDATNYCFNAGADCDEESVRAQYQHDWTNWPAAWGAPYDDTDGNGSYDPDVDVPGYPGADQTLWTVSSDIPTIVDEDSGLPTGDVVNSAPSLYGADPVGVELQVTMWAYAFGASDPLGNIHFKRARLIYTGFPDGSDYLAPAVLDTVYFTQWSDPDLGTYTDDYVGCDIDLSFGYVYNGNRLDGVFNGIYNLPCPAGGYDFLQGPVTAAGDTLGMTSFTYFGAGSSISDPDLSSYNGSLQFYNLMEGFLPRPEYPVQIPWTDLSTGEVTNFALSGDPVTGSGWVDGVQLPPGDRRLVMASGPFVMNLGDTADVVFALAAGIGLDAVSSVSVAKFVDTYAQFAYDNKFSLPSAPSRPSLTAVEMDGKITLDWGADAAAVNSTEEGVSGVEYAGFVFEGYNVYQLPGAGSPLTEGVKVATYDKINLVQNILDPAVDPLTGLVVEVAKQTGTNSGVQRFYNTDYDEIRGRPMSNGVGYHFAVTAYSFLADNEGSPFKTLESGEARLTAVPHDASPGVTVNNANGSEVTVDHTGTANASVDVNIINSGNLVDDTYTVYFDNQHYYRDLAGVWQQTAYEDSVGRTAGKVFDCSASTVTGAAIASADVGTIDLVLTFDLACLGAWIDGVQFNFPDGFASNVNSWAITGSGNVCSYGTGSGQNCVNLDGTMTGDSLIFGTVGTGYGFGAFETGNVFTVNVDSWFTGDFEALTVGYVVYDDGYESFYGGTTVNAVGSTTISELGYEFKTETHWNLRNSSNTVLLYDQTFVSGQDIYGGLSVDNMSKLHHNSSAAVTLNGLQVNVTGGYAAPNDWYGWTFEAGPLDISVVGEAYFDLGSYAQHGWALTARAVDTWGSGITSTDILQRDIQIRFTGEIVDEPTVTASGVVYYPALDEGGSYAFISGSRLDDLTNHPDPGTTEFPNDGSGPFRIKIPFEVWDMEAPDGPQQIDIDIYDRSQTYASGDTVYSFNYYNRMYTHFIHLPYNAVGDYGAVNVYDHLTWNVVWWDTQFNQGDVLTFNYANPIQANVDEFSFSTKANATASSNDVSGVMIYPNPYYGFHELETSRKAKYVSFNHLPQEATIDIYTMGGTYVCRIEKNDASQFATWDLNNQYGYPVASGLYIVRVTSGGEEKILKLALVQETQVLKYY